jgi:signal transduction histidine kinase/ligand-binding sensor domain-containing protein
MGGERRQRRGASALGMLRAWLGRPRSLKVAPLIALLILLAWGSGAYGLDPALDVSQYAHTSWKIRDGFCKGAIRAIAQTSDGYLWLGTEFGLLRFDGVKNTLWQSPTGQRLPSDAIYSLLAARDGTLWIGTFKGLASWKDSKLTQYPTLDGRFVFRLLEDREGSIWVGTIGSPAGDLCTIRAGTVHCDGEDGRLGVGIASLYEGSKGDLWVGVLGVKNGLWRWRPGPPKFYPLRGDPDGMRGLAEDTDGALLIGWNGGIYRFVDGGTKAIPLGSGLRQFRVESMTRDRNGGLWIGTRDRGLVHAHHGKTDAFLAGDGLSGDEIYTLFEDREGDMWVGTRDGLDRFRDVAVATFTPKQGLSGAMMGSVLADKDGSAWLATYKGLDRWRNGQITTYDKRDGKLHALAPDSLFQDSSRRIWVSTSGEFGYLQNNQFISVSGVPGGPVDGIGEDGEGNLWIANQYYGLFRLAGGKVVGHFSWSGLGNTQFASALGADDSRRGLWLGFYKGGVAYFKDGQIRESYTTADGLSGGRVASLRSDQDGAIWAATEGGLSRIENGHIATLSSKNGLPCDGVHWSMQDDDRSFWLYTPCGLIRVAASEMDAWIAAINNGKNPGPMIRSTVFDTSDGVRGLAIASTYKPQVAKSLDGKIWFVSLDGASVIDPRHLPSNNLPPPVHIEQLTADRKTYDSVSQLRLPPRIRDLEIDYAGLSYVAPEKVRFRYKLEGRDRDWQDVGNRRQAFYSDLSPGNYRFRVTACNNSGVWNEAGTFLDFSIAPAYYQTKWFRALCLAAFLGLLWALYQFRLHQLQRQFSAGLEARVSERTRIARELHDTLLQSFHGLMLRFQAATNLLPDNPAEAKRSFESTIDQAAQAITEGRDAVQGLRSSTVESNDLARAISTLGEELAANENKPNTAVFQVGVEGTPRNLHPILRDEVYRIGGEALRNAFKHAQAKRIEVEIRYDERQFRLRVRDDGKGIDLKVLTEDESPGHYGLRGMRERANLLGGNLSIWSELDSGTELELQIPAGNAYERLTGRRRPWFGKTFSGKSRETKL